MNSYIPNKWDDMIFYYANKIILHQDNRCEIFISPSNCLVSLHKVFDALPTVTELRSKHSEINHLSNKIIIEGQILFSAGVALFIDDKLLLIQRDAKAEISPLKWTSPAGRADREPLLTALKELHEEIIVLDTYTNQPIFITTPDLPYQKEVADIYTNTLRNNGLDTNPINWILIKGAIGPTNVTQTASVITHFGSETINTSNLKQKFFVFYNETSNTLELLLPLSITTTNQNNKVKLKFIDGEYERNIKVIHLSELLQINNSDLVSTMVEYKRCLYV